MVGLAIARKLAGRGASTVVIERHEGVGRETSSRNSEVHQYVQTPSKLLGLLLLCVLILQNP